MREVSSERDITFHLSLKHLCVLCFFSHASCQSHREMTFFFKRTFSHLRIRKTLYLRMLRKKHYLYHLPQQVKATARTHCAFVCSRWYRLL